MELNNNALLTHNAAQSSVAEAARIFIPGFSFEDARGEMVIDRKGHCSPVLRSSPAAGVGCGNPINKGIAAKIRKASELWEPENHLTQLRKEIDRKYEYKYSTLVLFFADLVREGRLAAEDSRGVSEDKLGYIRQHAAQSAA